MWRSKSADCDRSRGRCNRGKRGQGACPVRADHCAVIRHDGGTRRGCLGTRAATCALALQVRFQVLHVDDVRVIWLLRLRKRRVAALVVEGWAGGSHRRSLQQGNSQKSVGS